MPVMKIIFVAALLALAACATAVGTSYQAADAKGYGYSDQRIEADRYRVTFAGDGATPAEAVEDFALLRAAELARAGGYDWFRVISRVVDAEDKGGVGIGAGVGTGSYGRSSGVSVGVGGNVGAVGAKRFYTARLEVLMGKGSTPEGPDYYDAASLISSVEKTRGE
jgi:hypothetical protein